MSFTDSIPMRRMSNIEELNYEVTLQHLNKTTCQSMYIFANQITFDPNFKPYIDERCKLEKSRIKTVVRKVFLRFNPLDIATEILEFYQKLRDMQAAIKLAKHDGETLQIKIYENVHITAHSFFISQLKHLLKTDNRSRKTLQSWSLLKIENLDVSEEVTLDTARKLQELLKKLFNEEIKCKRLLGKTPLCAGVTLLVTGLAQLAGGVIAHEQDQEGWSYFLWVDGVMLATLGTSLLIHNIKHRCGVQRDDNQI